MQELQLLATLAKTIQVFISYTDKYRQADMHILSQNVKGQIENKSQNLGTVSVTVCT